jgi:hypothetical protein
MDDENGREPFNENLLTRLARARRTKLHRLQMRDACECVFYSVHRIVLGEFQCRSPRYMCGVSGMGKKTDLDIKLE